MRLRLDVAYDGTAFSGWAAQPEQRTVAGVLAAELTRLCGPIERLTAAGRTDAGVHATGQVSHVDVAAAAWDRVAGSVVHRLAGMLPTDVRVLAVSVAPDGFDARFSALRRCYEYRVSDAPWGSPPLRRHDTLAWPRVLRLDALNAASAGLLGEHDFAAYCKRKENAGTVRTLQRLDWRREDCGVLVATVHADAFCQAMVRSLVGALLAVGEGGRPVDWPTELLNRRARANEVNVVPPHGLTLTAVAYPADPAELELRAEQTRRRREAGR